MTDPIAAPDISSDVPSRIISGFTNLWGFQVQLTFVGLITVGVLLVIVLWRGSKRNGFNLWDMVTDVAADGVGRRTSGIKTIYLASFVVSSGVLIDQAIKNSASLPVLYAAYLATWCAALIMKVVYDKKDPPEMPRVREPRE